MVYATIFDLHWTLIRSTIDFQTMKRRLIDVCVAHGVDPTRFSERMKNHVIIRRGCDALRAHGATDADIASLMTRITATMNQVELEHVADATPLDQAVDVLRWLRQHKVKVGVITRSCRAYAKTALHVADMAAMVDVLVARDDVDHPKPDPRHLLATIKALVCVPSQAFLIGDSTLDASCAQQAGVRFIGVLTGTTTEHQLTRYPHYAVLPSIATLIPLLRRTQDMNR